HPSGGVGAFLRGSMSSVRGQPGPERHVLSAALAEAVESLVEPAIRISNEELFALHRSRDGVDLFFVVNPTEEPQEARVRLAGEVEPIVWDPTSGEERPA